MFTRIDTHTELLNEIVRHGLLAVTSSDGPVLCRAELYQRLLEALLEQAESENVLVTIDGCESVTRDNISTEGGPLVCECPECARKFIGDELTTECPSCGFDSISSLV